MMKAMKNKNQNNTNNKQSGNPLYSNNSLIKDFLSRKDFFTEESFERRPAIINKNSFIAALIDGFSSDGSSKLEIILPDSADLSINQNGGFSIFFWFLCKKQVPGVHRFILKRGNNADELTPSVGILPNGTNLFIKFNSSKHRIESLFSNRKIEINRMYCVTVTFLIDYLNNLTDVSLYLDGLLDSQVTTPGEPIHNQGNLYLGKSDSLSYGFIGCVADVILIPRVLNENEIVHINKQCIYNLNHIKKFMTFEIFSEKFEREILIDKYSKHTGNPVFFIENLELSNSELREIVKKFDNEYAEQLGNEDNSNKNLNSDGEINIKNSEKIDMASNDVIRKLQNYLGSPDSDTYINCKKITINAKFIYTVLILINNREDEIYVNRIISAFDILSETLRFQLKEKNLIEIAQILNCYNDKKIKLQTFFNSLSNISTNIFGHIYYVNNISYNDLNSVELHENLLLNSQNFKNFIDEEFERDMAKSSFTIRSLYDRNKKTRPQKEFNSRVSPDEADLVNQDYENITENKKNEELHNEVLHNGELHNEELHNAELPNEENKCLNHSNDINDLNDKDNQPNNLINTNLNFDYQDVPNLNLIKSEEKEENKEILVSIPTVQIQSNDKQPLISNSNTNEKQSEIVVTSNKKTEIRNEEEPNKNIAEDGKNTVDLISDPLKEVNITETNDMKAENQTQTFDLVSNFENKVMFKSSDRETNNRFMDAENMMSVNQLITNPNTKEQLNTKDNIENNNNIEANFPDDWNEGAIEIIINHCFECHKHRTTTRHYEYTFINYFNQIGEYLKDIFPNIQIIGNHSKPDYLGCFDIYLRGVGPKIPDGNDRFFLYRKIYTKKFPEPQEVGDKLIALVMLYGSSSNLEAAQMQFINAYPLIPYKNCHEYPAVLSEEGEKEKKELEKRLIKPKKDDPERTKLYCQNWGCGIIFVHVENNLKGCRYHPGIWQFGSNHGYWPEAWSCCEGGWNDPGCSAGPHLGIRVDKRPMLCLNFGEINPRTNHPDSACGIYFTIKENEGCKFHSGYRKQSGNFSCCQSSDDGCQETTHQTAEWPDERAKLYFYPKQINNPGISSTAGKVVKTHRSSVAQQIIKCVFFKPVVLYPNPKTKFELLKMKKEREKDEPRYCIRWACEKIYKESENEFKNCKCHPGKWDHGSTGTKMVDFIREMALIDNVSKQVILWKPHWTCCRKSWDSPGCKLMKHRGPLLDEHNSNPAILRQYKWPDQRLKTKFTKIVSDKWKEALEKYKYNEFKVRKICKEFFGDSKKVISDLPILCDQLKLYLLVVSDNIDYQMKFMDIATQADPAVKFFNVGNYVDPDKFIKWWFMDYEKIIEIVTPEIKK